MNPRTNYYLAHQNGSHHLVLADDIGSHSPLPNGPSTIAYYPGTRAAHVHDEDFIDSWQGIEDIASGRYAADDYDLPSRAHCSTPTRRNRAATATTTTKSTNGPGATPTWTTATPMPARA